MAITKFSTVQEEEEYFEKLLKSNTIQFNYEVDDRDIGTRATRSPWTHKKTINIPEDIATSVSHEFRALLQKIEGQEGNHDKALGFDWMAIFRFGPSSFAYLMGDIITYCDKKPLHEQCLMSFATWTYSGRVLCYEAAHHKLWRFGQLLGSPRFMNAVMESLCLSLSSAIMSPPQQEDCYRVSEDLDSCWNEAYFRNEDQRAVVMVVNWENKKMLKFLLDVFAHKIIHKQHYSERDAFSGLLNHDTQLAKHVLKAIGAREARADHTEPWEGENIKEYLVNEDMSESRFESHCGFDPEKIRALKRA